MLIRSVDREAAPAFFTFLEAAAPTFWDDAEIGAFFDAESGVPRRYAKGFLKPGEGAPTLVLRALGHLDALFDPATPEIIYFDVALVGHVDRHATSEEAKRITLAVLAGVLADLFRVHAGLAVADPPAAARAISALCGLGLARPWAPRVTGALRIDVTAEDADALARLAAKEAEVLVASATAALAYGSVVDVVLNRVAAQSFYGGSIQAVIEKPGQFEPLRGGAWRALPQADAVTRQAVAEHLLARMRGSPSVIGEATHFLNPVVIAERGHAIPSWAVGWRQGQRIGLEGSRHVHYFLNPAGDPRPRPYRVHLSSA